MNSTGPTIKTAIVNVQDRIPIDQHASIPLNKCPVMLLLVLLSDTDLPQNNSLPWGTWATFTLN